MEAFRPLKESLWDFLAQVEYSSYYAYDLPDKPEWGEKPAGAVVCKGRWVPDRPDGITVGNREIYAALGIPELTAEQVYEYYSGSGEYNYHINPSRISMLVGPRKEHTFCKILFNNFKAIDYFCEYTQNGETTRKLLSQFERKKLYRVLKTPMAIAEVMDHDLQITIVSFAPELNEEKDPPVLCQYLLIRNLGMDPIQNIHLGPAMINYGSNWNIDFSSNLLNQPLQNFQLTCNEDLSEGYCLGLIGPAQCYHQQYAPEEAENSAFYQQWEYTELNDPLEKEDNDPEPFGKIKHIGFCTLDTIISELQSSQTMAIPWFFVPSKNIEDEKKQYQQIIEWDLNLILQNTYENSQKWTNQASIQTSDDKLNDLIDSILNLLKLHIGYDAIHTGSVYYEHNTAFVRDNYWIQRSLAKAGHIDAAQKNLAFMFSAWEQTGLRNSYSIKTRSSTPRTTEMRVELPAIMALDVENLWYWTGDLQLLSQYYSFTKDCLDLGLASPNDLFILNSDETWIWPAYVNEMDYYTDNSMIMLAGMAFGQKIASLLGNENDYMRWHDQFQRWLTALNTKLVIADERRYATGIDTSGFMDLSILPSVVAHPVMLHLWPLLSQDQSTVSPYALIENGLNLIWEIMEPTGIIRSHSRTTAISGITLGEYLYAVTEFNLPFKNEVFAWVKDFPDCTGSLYEIHDMYYPAWGTERRRAWDTATLLEGILHYLFGVEPEERSILFNPCPPQETGYAMIRDLLIKEKWYQIKCFAPEDNFEFSINFNDEANDDSESEISSFLNELGESFVVSIQTVKEIAVRSSEHGSYHVLVQTDIPGRIRYYPMDEETILEIGIEDNLFMKPKLRYTLIPSEHKNEITVDFALVSEDFLIKFEDQITLKFEFEESQEKGSLEIKNESIYSLQLILGEEVVEIPAGEEKTKEVFIPNKELLESLMLEHNENYQTNAFFNHLEQFINVNGSPHVLILYDENSKKHAIEVIKQLAIIKWTLYPMQPFDPHESLWHQTNGNNLIIISNDPPEKWDQFHEIEKLDDLKAFIVYGFREYSNHGIIYLQNQGDVYEDTHDLCEDLGLFLIPNRDKAISMHPLGHYRLADKIGMPASDPFALRITASQTVNYYIAGASSIGTQIDMIFDPKQSLQRFIPEKPYVSFYTMQPYCDFALAAGGIATGKNCIRLICDCDSDESIEVIFDIHFDQTYQIIHLSGAQRERILDPITIEKQRDGDKLVHIILHPGQNVHEIICANEEDAKKRGFTFVFARYPRTV